MASVKLTNEKHEELKGRVANSPYITWRLLSPSFADISAEISIEKRMYNRYIALIRDGQLEYVKEAMKEAKRLAKEHNYLPLKDLEKDLEKALIIGQKKLLIQKVI